jgi:3-oxoacyl-[acyl-carrier protein] reductase
MNTAFNKRKVAIVTGARRGIGRATACCLAEAGFDVVVNDIVRDADFDETLRQLRDRGAKAVAAVGDIAEPSTHQAIVETAFAELGTVDCLVNNAGIQVSRREDLMRVTPQGFDRLLRVNLRGTFFLTQAVAARMIEDADYREGRSIVTISSANAVMASVEKAEYCIAKAGLSMMNRLFALRLARHGISCHEIQPGLIDTDMIAPAHAAYSERIKDGLTPIQRWGLPADIGRAVTALATQAIPFTTGQAFQIDGGLQLPRL